MNPLYVARAIHSMGTCEYCYKHLDPGPDRSRYHDACDVEWHERVKNRLCVCCREPVPAGRNYFCPDCGYSSEYKGYPGP